MVAGAFITEVIGAGIEVIADDRNMEAYAGYQ
jgi:hypothetical protein